LKKKIENKKGNLLTGLWEVGRLDDSSLSYNLYVLATVYPCIIL